MLPPVSPSSKNSILFVTYKVNYFIAVIKETLIFKNQSLFYMCSLVFFTVGEGFFNSVKLAWFILF